MENKVNDWMMWGIEKKILKLFRKHWKIWKYAKNQNKIKQMEKNNGLKENQKN